MKLIDETETPVIVRTDYLDDDSWYALCEAVRADCNYTPSLASFLDNPLYAAKTTDEVLDAIRGDLAHNFIVIADRESMDPPEYAVCIAGVGDSRGRSFRAGRYEVMSIVCNLAIGNMCFDDYADAADPDGVYRGF